SARWRPVSTTSAAPRSAPISPACGTRRSTRASSGAEPMAKPHGPLRVGVGGPVGSGKTALMDALCKRLRDRYDIAAITNDIYTKWDAEFLVRSGALAPERIAGVETGGCPHTAIRVDASLDVMERDSKRMRGARPFVFSNLRTGQGVDAIVRFIEEKGGL